MAFNNLRRRIEQERKTTYGEPVEKIMAQGKLLDMALAALGGPVQDNRPQVETHPHRVATIASALVAVAGIEDFDARLAQQAILDDLARGTVVDQDTVIIDRDPDEVEH